MPDETTPSPPTPGQLARVLRQHLASLEAAGVEWLPLSRLPLPLFTAGPAPSCSAPTTIVRSFRSSKSAPFFPTRVCR